MFQLEKVFTSHMSAPTTQPQTLRSRWACRARYPAAAAGGADAADGAGGGGGGAL